MIPKYRLNLSLALMAIVGICLLVPIQTMAQGEAGRLQEIKSRGTLIAGIRRDNPPHSFIDGQGQWVGFDVDIAEALAKQLGLKLKRVPVDELTRISYLRSGKIDIAAASMSHTHKRDEQVDFSQTYFWSSQTFLVRKDEVTSLDDLAGKRVGMDRGSHAIGNWKAWLKKHGHSATDDLIVEFSNKSVAVEAVRRGSIAGYAEDAEMLAAFAKKDPSLTVLDAAIGMKQDGIGIREDDSKLRDAINFALQAIESSGEYESIYNRWFGPDTDTPVPLKQRIEVWPHG